METKRNLYFIGIEPPVEIIEEIRDLQNQFIKYKATRQLKIPVHITLIPPFHLDQQKEDELVKFYQLQNEGFDIELQNFGNFRSKVIFVEVVASKQLNAFRESLQLNLREKNLVYSQGLNFHPHITLANRDLSASMFLSAWNDFEKKTYYRLFRATNFTIYKHISGNWTKLPS